MSLMVEGSGLKAVAPQAIPGLLSAGSCSFVQIGQLWFYVIAV